MKRRRGIIGILVLLALIVAVSAGALHREMRQQRLNRDLIVALKKFDVSEEVRLLKAGADANARDVGDNEVSLKEVLGRYWRRLRTGKPREEAFTMPALLIPSHRDNSFPDDPQQYALVSPLLDYGADINSRDEDGSTLLFDAVGPASSLARLLLL